MSRAPCRAAGTLVKRKLFSRVPHGEENQGFLLPVFSGPEGDGAGGMRPILDLSVSNKGMAFSHADDQTGAGVFTRETGSHP